MAEFLFILVAGAALLIVAGFGALALTYLTYAAGRVLGVFAEHLSARVGAAFTDFAESADDHARRRRMQEEIFVGAQSRKQSGRVDREFVAAAQATKCLSSAFKVVKNSMETCCELQRFTAQAQGAVEMAEVEWDPLCASLRERVADSLDVSLALLQAYPRVAADRLLLKQLIAMRSLRGICADCELLRYSVRDAPALCTPASSMNRQPPGQGKHP